MQWKKWYLIPIILVVLISIWFVFFRKSGIPVKEIRVKNTVVKRTVSAAGSIRSENEANISFPTLGKLQDIGVKKGDVVKKYQYLAFLDNVSESQTTQSLKDARDIALRDLELYVENYATNMDEVGGQDEYSIGVRRYEELLSRAEAIYQAQLANLGDTYLYAPFDGKIVDVYKEPGETVLVGESIVMIANEDSKIFKIELDQEDFSFLSEGQEVEISLDAYEDEVFVGRVKNLPTYVTNDGGGDFVIDIEITDERKGNLLFGMTGDAYIILSKTNQEVPVLTFDEVEYDIEDRPYVFVLEGDRVEIQYLEIGLKGDIYTEIKTKIEKPIIQASDAKYKLEEGVRVKLIR